MIQYRIFLIVIFLLLFASCKKEEKDPSNSGEIKVSTRRIKSAELYYVNAYSFENAQYVKIFMGNEDADLVPVSSSEDAPGVLFSTTTSNNFGFYLNEEFNDLPSAEAYFNSYTTAGAPSFTSLTGLVSPFQVYTLKTARKNWVKILVKDIRPVSTDEIASHAEADIRYVIQRNGTAYFPE